MPLPMTGEASSVRHKHVAIREYVRELLSDCAAGTPTPSERELVQRFGVARMTVRQALDALVGEGLLVRVPGRGTFVAEPPPRRRAGVESFTEQMRRRGLLPESSTVIARREKAGPGVARALGITERDPVLHWQRLRRADGIPMCVEDAYLNEVLLPGFLQSGMPTSLYAALAERGLRPTWAEDAVTADVAGAAEATMLEVDPGASVLRVARRGLAHDTPIEVSRAVFRADRFTLWVQFDAD